MSPGVTNTSGLPSIKGASVSRNLRPTFTPVSSAITSYGRRPGRYVIEYLIRAEQYLSALN